MFHLDSAVEQIAMGIPPGHTALVGAEAAFPMPRTQRERHTTLVASVIADGGGFLNAGLRTDISQTEGLYRVA